MSLIKTGPLAHFDCGEDCMTTEPAQTDDCAARLRELETHVRRAAGHHFSKHISVRDHFTVECYEINDALAQLERYAEALGAVRALEALVEDYHADCGDECEAPQLLAAARQRLEEAG